MQILIAHRFLAAYLTLFGCFGDLYASAVLMNSNAIKNPPGVSAGKGTETVSPSPGTPPSGGAGHKTPTGTLQVIITPQCVKVLSERRVYIRVHVILKYPDISYGDVFSDMLKILQQAGVCKTNEDCGKDEFCNDARGVCLSCRKSRKRCMRDSMCCAGNRCSNGEQRNQN